MRQLAPVLILMVLAAASWADTPVVTSPGATAVCAEPQECHVGRQERKQAFSAYRQGQRYKQHGRLEEAYDAFKHAAGLVPYNTDYASAREFARQQLVYNDIEAGNKLLEQGDQKKAVVKFRSALELDPTNEFALQRLRDAIGDDPPKVAPKLQLVASADELQVKPRPVRADFHFTGDVRQLYQEIAKIFGLRVAFDESVTPREVRFDVNNLSFFQAAALAGKVSHAMWASVSENEFIVAADTPANHKQYDRMAMRTFYISDATEATQLNDLVNTLRTVFEVRMISVQPSKSTLVLRAPTEAVEAAARFLEAIAGPQPQVMLEIQAFEVNHTVMRALGISPPLEFNMFNVPAAASLLLQQPNVQQLINQLFASGGINQANVTALQGLLAQLQSQSQNPLLSQPFFTFGGGITRFAVTVPPLTATAQLSDAQLATLEHMNMRAMQGKPATFRLGTRYPIMNASFSPIFNSPALASVIGNGSYLPAFPSFQYEDLGLSVKATVFLHAQDDVTLNLETAIRALGVQSLNGVPVITNREYKGTITVKDGEPAVVAGMVTRSEQKSLSGLPGFANIPGLGRLASTTNDQDIEAEVLIVITPHVLSHARNGATEVYLGPGH
jgi:general secretion pathway protein D